MTDISPITNYLFDKICVLPSCCSLVYMKVVQGMFSKEVSPSFRNVVSATSRCNQGIGK